MTSFEVELSHGNVDGVWQKDGHILKNNNRLRMTAKGRVHSLTISNLTLDDTGTYIFSVENIRSLARLEVKGIVQKKKKKKLFLQQKHKWAVHPKRKVKSLFRLCTRCCSNAVCPQKEKRSKMSSSSDDPRLLGALRKTVSRGGERTDVTDLSVFHSISNPAHGKRSRNSISCFIFL